MRLRPGGPGIGDETLEVQKGMFCMNLLISLSVNKNYGILAAQIGLKLII